MEQEQYKFAEGDIVYEVTSPHLLMLITSQKGIIYYCQQIDGMKKKPSAYMERDLKAFHKAEDSKN
ncbi:hypothetical protein [Fulvivirga lutea]|uniref:Uncharacterized protein n=1 Tax=Fulvivirga lutea TaxID=2810512 RepID=A0A974ZZN6_9BACT|nr:hypothetical protein [Fulvivirga lutea]QSE96444.1 hypothetical protein JR347_12630 [Fulvivirga lutea]